MVERSMYSFINFSLLEIRVVTCKWQLFLFVPDSVAEQRQCVNPSCQLTEEKD